MNLPGLTGTLRTTFSIGKGSLKRTFFSNSGTEAIETALMMACLATGRSEIIALRVGFDKS